MLRALLYVCASVTLISTVALADTAVDRPAPLDLAPAAVESVSCGCTNRGALAAAAELPVSGLYHVIPAPWRDRGYRFATAELVGLLERVAEKVNREHPGALLGVGDLSRMEGGTLPGHRSHQSGRDADLMFYALDPHGRPFPPDEYMPIYTRTGRATYARAPQWSRTIPERYFDLARNWALVKALLTDDQVEVDRIFVSRRIRTWLLRYAEELGEPEELRKRAALVVRPPGKAQGHDDHFHIRIKCSDRDILLGRCNDDSAPRRRKKYYAKVSCPIPQFTAQSE